MRQSRVFIMEEKTFEGQPEESVQMDGKLFAQAMIKFVFGVLLVGALLFLPAGTFAYP